MNVDYHALLPEEILACTILVVLVVEWVAWVPLLIGIVVLGLFPRFVFGVTDDAVSALLHLVGPGT